MKQAKKRITPNEYKLGLFNCANTSARERLINEMLHAFAYEIKRNSLEGAK